MLYSPRVDARIQECIRSGRKLRVVEQRESRFAIDNLVTAQQGNACIVDMSRKLHRHYAITRALQSDFM